MSADNKAVRNMCFTMNNPTAPVVFDSEWMQYLVFQLERGDEGTPHYQGYIEAKKLMRLKAWREALPGAHLSIRRGTAKQASDYCKKEDTRLDGPWEHGEMKQQGRRTDILALVEMAKTGVPVRDAVEALPEVMFRYTRNYNQIKALYSPLDRWQETILYIGPPGTGKSRRARAENPGIYVIPVSGNGLWFDGYDGQETVLLDDFGGKSCFPLSQFLRVIDRYAVQVPTKGGHVWWNPRKIVITSNVEIEHWYDYENRADSLAAVQRRITSVVRFHLHDPWHPPPEVRVVPPVVVSKINKIREKNRDHKLKRKRDKKRGEKK